MRTKLTFMAALGLSLPSIPDEAVMVILLQLEIPIWCPVLVGPNFRLMTDLVLGRPKISIIDKGYFHNSDKRQEKEEAAKGHCSSMLSKVEGNSVMTVISICALSSEGSAIVMTISSLPSGLQKDAALLGFSSSGLSPKKSRGLWGRAVKDGLKDTPVREGAAIRPKHNRKAVAVGPVFRAIIRSQGSVRS